MNATKETDPDILRRMIEIGRNQAAEIQASLSNELDRLQAELEAHKLDCGNCIEERVQFRKIKEDNDHLQAEVAARQWQPIATAPKDGTLILASWAGSGMYPIITRWLKTAQAWSHPFNKPVNPPSHWMPLPDPPKETEG